MGFSLGLVGSFLFVPTQKALVSQKKQFFDIHYRLALPEDQLLTSEMLKISVPSDFLCRKIEKPSVPRIT